MENKMKLQFACSLIFSKNSKLSNVISCYRSFTVLILLQRLFCQPTAAGYTNLHSCTVLRLCGVTPAEAYSVYDKNYNLASPLMLSLCRTIKKKVKTDLQ